MQGRRSVSGPVVLLTIGTVPISLLPDMERDIPAERRARMSRPVR
jgi:hypothetical protein